MEHADIKFTETETMKDILCHHPFVTDFRRDILGRFADEVKTVNIPKGKTLFLQEDQAEWFYYIKNGWVKLFRETQDGNDVVLNVVSEGYIFGETALFEQNTYPFSAEIVEDATLLAFPLLSLEKEIGQDKMLVLEMLDYIGRQNVLKDLEIEHRTIQNASQRIGCFLLRLIKENADGPVTLRLPYDKTLIAARLGMQPETFSRALTTLQKKVKMRVKGSAVTIENVEQLAGFSCGACSGLFPCSDLRPECVRRQKTL